MQLESAEIWAILIYFNPAVVALRSKLHKRYSENTGSSVGFRSLAMIVHVMLILVFTSVMTVHQNTQSLTCSARWIHVSST